MMPVNCKPTIYHTKCVLFNRNRLEGASIFASLWRETAIYVIFMAIIILYCADISDEYIRTKFVHTGMTRKFIYGCHTWVSNIASFQLLSDHALWFRPWFYYCLASDLLYDPFRKTDERKMLMVSSKTR